MTLIKIAYFFEDFGHSTLIQGLIHRIANEEYGNQIEIRDIPLCQRGGSRILNEFRQFMHDWRNDRAGQYDLIIIGHDCNCIGPAKTKKKFAKLAERANYQFEWIVYALPDPYVERWYLADPNGFRSAINGTHTPDSLRYVHNRSQRHYYKDELIKALRENGMDSSIGGAEFGEDIARCMDIQAAGTVDENFAKFIGDFKQCLKRKL